MAQPKPGQMCEYCKRNLAVEFCTGCMHWVCKSPICQALAGVKTLQNKLSAMVSRNA